MTDNSSYGAGYRDSLQHTIIHIENRLREEQAYKDLWIDKAEYRGYLLALNNIRDYLLWVKDKENQ